MRLVIFAVFAALILACQNQPAAEKKMTGLAGGLQDSTIIRLWPSEMDTLRMSDPNIPLVDLRTELEFRTSHIYRSINCPFADRDFAQRIVKLGPNRPVIVYDSGSEFSLRAAEKMRSLGFKRIYELAGGIGRWGIDGRTLVSGASKIDSSYILR